MASAVPAQTSLAELENAAFEIVQAAGERALAAYRADITLEFKGDKQDDPVTVADREVEGFLRDKLRARFPSHGILGEEGADVDASSDYLWVLDPLDGTANFASHLPLWGISVGLLHRGRPVVGLIWVPVGPDLSAGVYHARLGGGARWQRERTLHVSEGDDQRGRIIALPSFSWLRFFLRRPPGGAQRGLDARSLGSISVEQALVAAGVLRLAIFVQPKIWDVAAGGLIVQEAGGRSLVWRDRRWAPLDYYDRMPPSRGKDAASLRHWSRPVLVATPTVAETVTRNLVWLPAPPRFVRSLLRRTEY